MALIGAQLVASIRTAADMETVLNAGVRESWFRDIEGKLFSTALGHYRAHGVVPSRTTLLAAIPEAAEALPEAVEEPLGFYLEQAKRRALVLFLNGTVRRVMPDLQAGNPEKALATLIEDMGRVDQENLGQGKPYDIAGKVEERIQEYLAKHESMGAVDGLPTPWPTMNRDTMGFHPGEFTLFAARIRAGKTWTLLRMLLEVWLSGKSPLLVSMEMGPPKIARRLDGLLSRVPYGDLVRGMLDHANQEEYMRELRETYPTLPQLMCFGPPRVRSVADLDSLIRRYKPNGGIWIDGVNRLRSGDDQDRYRRVAEAADDLKFLGEARGQPIIGTAHFNRKGGKMSRTNVTPDLEEIGYALALGEQADNVFALFQGKDFQERKKMLIRFLKTREADSVDGIITNFDLDAGDFDEVAVWSEEDVEDDGQDVPF